MDVSLEAKTTNPKRKAVEQFIISYIDKLVSGKFNTELYTKLFNSMSDEQFDKFMNKLKNNQATLSVIIPNNRKDLTVNTENNIKLAKELGFDFFQQLEVGRTDTQPAYKTVNKYMILKLPVRRTAQLLTKKISIPKDNTHIDQSSGQVTGASKGSKISAPEVQVLAGLGLKTSLRELMKIRGGDLGAGNAMNQYLQETGIARQTEVERYSTGVVSKKTLKAYYAGMHIANTW